MGRRDAAWAHLLVAAADAVLAESANLAAHRDPPGQAPASASELDLWSLARPQPDRALRLDRAVRRVDDSVFPAWRACSPHALRAGELPALTPLIHALGMHPDGRVRAAAVEVMAPNSASHLAALAVRCVDPAPSVRGCAVGLALPAIATTRLYDLVPLAVILLGDRMGQVSPTIVDATERRLLSDPPATIEQLRRDSHPVVRVLAEEPSVRTADLLGCLLQRGDAARWLFERAIDRATASDVHRFLDQLGRSIPPDQLVWLRASARWPGLDEIALTNSQRARLLRAPVAQLRGFLNAESALEDAGADLVRALLDTRAAPRRMAQRLLAHTGVDVAAFYRQLAEVTPMAIIGLGEVGRPDDTALVASLLASEHAAVRRAAVSACKLDVDGLLEHLVAALDDVDKRVARAAAHRLRRRVDLVGIERLFEVGQRQAGPHARAQATSLLLMLPDDQLLAALLGDRSRSAAHHDFVIEVLREWRDRSPVARRASPPLRRRHRGGPPPPAPP